MKIFITGATGFIGGRLAIRLADEGHQVHALIRSRQRAKHLNHPSITLFEGNLLDKESISRSMQGCDAGYHLAAYARVWSKDPQLPYRVNVEGTSNIFQAALDKGLKRVVFTSTGGTLGPSDGGNPVDEDTPRRTGFFNAYEETKTQAEQLARDFTGKGLEVVTVNPTRVYGPGLISASAAMTKIIHRYIRGKWRIIPGNGKKYGNYVYVDDVVEGQILAMAKGRPGERYITGGENTTYDGFFESLSQVSGKNFRMVHIRYPLLRVITRIQYTGARLIGRPPLITPEWIKKYLHHWACTSRKAEQELGYRITSLEEGLSKTIEWLRLNQH
ncbi:MAG: SDR family oxidoreductase [Bacteroidales bacterium]